MKLIRTAGGIVWRWEHGIPRVAVVHRPKRADWSLPKGRLEAGECWQDGARREIAEETGCEVRLDRFAGGKLQLDRPQPKLTLYWHARLVREGPLPTQDEVDEVAWLSRGEALARLDHASDRRLLLCALGEGASSRRGAFLGPDHLGELVLVDSSQAAEALPSLLGTIARAVDGDASDVDRA